MSCVLKYLELIFFQIVVCFEIYKVKVFRSIFMYQKTYFIFSDSHFNNLYFFNKFNKLKNFLKVK